MERGLDWELPTPIQNSTLLLPLLLSLSIQKNTPHTRRRFLPEYDYIIIGSGSGGAVVASRLTEIGCVNVLLLEAGISPPKITEVPALSQYFIGTKLEWGYKTVPQKHSGFGFKDRRFIYPRGKAVGGSTSINDMVHIRGNPRDYNRWAREGAEGWSYPEVLKYFKKLEDYQVVGGDSEYHGFGGPITTMEPPTSLPPYREYRDAVHQAGRDLGYPFVDPNGRYQFGFSKYTSSVRNYQRCGTAKAYLVPAENRPNLHILKEAFVKKILLSNKRAVGVEFDFKGKSRTVRARQEVIVSAGVFNTPQLLMLSGIGPKEHLEELNIPVIADLPVGLYMNDHVASIIAYEIDSRFRPIEENLKRKDYISQYIIARQGLLALAQGQTNNAFLTNEGPNSPPNSQPNHQLYFYAGEKQVIGETVRGKNQLSFDEYHDLFQNKTLAWCVAQSINSKSLGSVRLNSTDPYDPPLIDPNYYGVKEDVVDVAYGLKHCSDVFNSPALKRIGAKKLSPPYPGCEKYENDEIKYFTCVARSVSFVYHHATATARMGYIGDPKAVVDPRLRVQGIDGLRVVDASVMRRTPSGNTNIPTIMVGEKGADMIKEDIKCLRKSCL